MSLDAVPVGVRDEEPEARDLVPVARQMHRVPPVFVRVPEAKLLQMQSCDMRSAAISGKNPLVHDYPKHSGSESSSL